MHTLRENIPTHSTEDHTNGMLYLKQTLFDSEVATTYKSHRQQLYNKVTGSLEKSWCCYHPLCQAHTFLRISPALRPCRFQTKGGLCSAGSHGHISSTRLHVSLQFLNAGRTYRASSYSPRHWDLTDRTRLAHTANRLNPIVIF